jgi:acyl-CoA synthetase (NDP forming)
MPQTMDENRKRNLQYLFKPRSIAILGASADQKKPVVILKAGSTEAGKRAAYSHTGAMVGSARAYEAVFKEKGVIVARDIAQLVDYALALFSTPLPTGRRVGVMTESGGGGVLLTERCAELNLDVSETSGGTKEKLKVVVPALGSLKNPVDLKRGLNRSGQSLSNPKIVKGAVGSMLEAGDPCVCYPHPLCRYPECTGNLRRFSPEFGKKGISG